MILRLFSPAKYLALRRFRRDLDSRLAARKQARSEGRVYVSGYVRAK
jgi:hypothetical protein